MSTGWISDSRIMIACLDVHYRNGLGRAAAVVFQDWSDAEPIAEYGIAVPVNQDYRPGHFYERELTPLLEVIGEIEEDIDIWVVDGYCHLDDQGTPGLGAVLASSIGEGIRVIGVAKNRFHKSDHAIEVFRGESERPLFVTAVGMELETAAQTIGTMEGEFRIPTILKRVDQLSRSEA